MISQLPGAATQQAVQRQPNPRQAAEQSTGQEIETMHAKAVAFTEGAEITAYLGPETLSVGEHSEEYGNAFWEKTRAEWALFSEEQGGSRKRERVAMIEAVQPVSARELTSQ